MKAASEKQRADLAALLRGSPKSAAAHGWAFRLHRVADTFLMAQQQRHAADYDSSKQWARLEVVTHIAKIDAAFKSWQLIRDEPAAQTYLLSLLPR